MCGIAGILSSSISVQEREKRLIKGLDDLNHRGPDDQKYISNDYVSVGMTRLSIIDLGNGMQPFFNQDKSIIVVGNGEIYNYKELIKDFSLKPDRNSNSDMAIIPNLYEKFGEQFVNYLRGMFAIAIWDSKLNKLLLIRDRVGQKPIYYYCDKEQISFSSEINSLKKIVNHGFSINHSSIAEYFINGRISSENCIYNSIKKVKPSEIISFEFNNGKAKPFRLTKNIYWSPWEQSYKLDKKNLLDQIEEKLIESIKIRCRSDVPVGSFLSGGIDSSLISAIARKNFNKDFQTFSINFDDNKTDESKYSFLVSQHISSKHAFFNFNEHVDPSIWTKTQSYFSEPFADISAIPTYLVSKLASEKVKVILSGDGADEIFGGYESYLKLLFIKKTNDLSHGILKYLSPYLSELNKSITKNNNNTLDKILSLITFNGDYFDYYQKFKDTPNEKILNIFRTDYQEEIKKGFLENFNYQKNIFLNDKLKHPAESAMHLQLNTTLPDMYFNKVDTMSMRNSIEVRSPFSDHHLIELLYQVDLDKKIKFNNSKYLLKKIAEKYIPNNVIYRRKQGFTPPIKDWIRNKKSFRCFVLDTINQKSVVDDLIDKKIKKNLIENYINGKNNNWNLINRMVSLVLWSNVNSN